MSILSDQLFDGAKALDVGSGSGYLTACMAFMVGSRGRVIGIDHIPELIEISTKNVSEDCPHFIQEERVKFVGKNMRNYKTLQLLFTNSWCREKGKRNFLSIRGLFPTTFENFTYSRI